MNGNPLPPKKEVALALLERGSVHVHLDPRATGVVVPAWFKRQPQLVLQVGLNMPVPIHDLRVDDDGMSCTLSFNRSPFFCIVPWSCVYAMVGDDGRGMVWPEDVPPEVALQARAREGEPAAKKPAAERPLAVVKSPAEAARKPAAKAAKTVKTGTARATEGEKPKKPRAKKATDDAATLGGAGAKRRSKSGDAKAAEGVLVPIGSSSTPPKPARPARPAHESSPSPRPAPKAVPQVAPQPRPSADDTSRPRPAPAPQPASPRADAPRPGPTTRPGGKQKREIPPYLRVVK
jgi:stringent starvation protein B